MIFEAAVTATAVTVIGTPPFNTVNALVGGMLVVRRLLVSVKVRVTVVPSAFTAVDDNTGAV